MPNITEEQIEAAAEALYVSLCTSSAVMVTFLSPWKNLRDFEKTGYRSAARAAAPLLQMQWEPATSDELKSSCQAFTMDGLRTHTCHGVPLAAMEYAIREFVSRRNFALIPKPVDPRVDKIEALLISRNPTMLMPREMARYILAALDAKE